MATFAGEHEEKFRLLDAEAENEIGRFEKFFQKLGNEGLAKPERAILKTFLLWQGVDEDTRESLVKKDEDGTT